MIKKRRIGARGEKKEGRPSADFSPPDHRASFTITISHTHIQRPPAPDAPATTPAKRHEAGVNDWWGAGLNGAGLSSRDGEPPALPGSGASALALTLSSSSSDDDADAADLACGEEGADLWDADEDDEVVGNAGLLGGGSGRGGSAAAVAAAAAAAAAAISLEPSPVAQPVPQALTQRPSAYTPPPPAPEDLRELVRNLVAAEVEEEEAGRRRRSLQAPSPPQPARAVAVGWLVSASDAHGFHQETLHLAASLLDRYLGALATAAESGAGGKRRAGRAPALPPPPPTDLPLLAGAALLVAAKHEEGCAPPAADLAEQLAGVGTCPSASPPTAEALLRAEGALLAALGFRVCSPTAPAMLALLARAASAPPPVAADAALSTDLALLDGGVTATHRPSALAAAALVVADAGVGVWACTSTSAPPAVSPAAAAAAALACPDPAALASAAGAIVRLRREAAGEAGRLLKEGEPSADASSPLGAVVAKFARPAWLGASLAGVASR